MKNKCLNKHCNVKDIYDNTRRCHSTVFCNYYTQLWSRVKSKVKKQKLSKVKRYFEQVKSQNSVPTVVNKQTMMYFQY